MCFLFVCVCLSEPRRQSIEWITHLNTQHRITDGSVRPYALFLIYTFIPFNPHLLFDLSPSFIPNSILSSFAHVLWIVYMLVKHELFYVHCYFLIFINGNVNYITCFSLFHKILCLYDSFAVYVAFNVGLVLNSRMYVYTMFISQILSTVVTQVTFNSLKQVGINFLINFPLWTSFRL